MKKKYFLFLDGDLITDNVPGFTSLKAACNSYQKTALELGRYGQSISAFLHIAADLEGVTDYPDYALSLGPRGGVIKTRVY